VASQGVVDGDRVGVQVEQAPGARHDRGQVAEVREACPKPHADVHWTSVDGGPHDVWTQTYDLSAGYGDVYAWMLANPKP